MDSDVFDTSVVQWHVVCSFYLNMYLIKYKFNYKSRKIKERRAK
jgi:hypothetical protein